MKNAIVSVITKENKLLYHSRKGLTENKNDATLFKTIDHARRVCRKKYRRMLGHELIQYKYAEV